eukprot:TRINITY_DN45141_c0_g1_i1.p1 TRINITY_DN45141_c0_g1~~TRINITY_DN45141_c0_g1_i1.p1  ORF type:complete len:507 (-),score=71.55 TRINITY_DN45141_c0_g1_i1:65-1513(-)
MKITMQKRRENGFCIADHWGKQMDGMEVEMLGQEQGFHDSYFRCKVVEIERDRMILQSLDFENDYNTQPFQENIPLPTSRVRPAMPKSMSSKEIWQYRYGEMVDVWINDVWWFGVVLPPPTFGAKLVQVFLPCYQGEEAGPFLVTDKRLIRPGMEWVPKTEEWEVRYDVNQKQTWQAFQLWLQHNINILGNLQSNETSQSEFDGASQEGQNGYIGKRRGRKRKKVTNLQYQEQVIDNNQLQEQSENTRLRQRRSMSKQQETRQVEQQVGDNDQERQQDYVSKRRGRKSRKVVQQSVRENKQERKQANFKIMEKDNNLVAKIKKQRCSARIRDKQKLNLDGIDLREFGTNERKPSSLPTRGVKKSKAESRKVGQYYVKVPVVDHIYRDIVGIDRVQENLKGLGKTREVTVFEPEITKHKGGIGDTKLEVDTSFQRMLEASCLIPDYLENGSFLSQDCDLLSGIVEKESSLILELDDLDISDIG